MAYGEPYKCRAEINTSAKQIILQDGTSYIYSSLIYCPKEVPDLQPGTKILITDGTITRVEGIVKSFSRGQLNCRIWV